jgi:hypothetical protein
MSGAEGRAPDGRARPASEPGVAPLKGPAVKPERIAALFAFPWVRRTRPCFVMGSRFGNALGRSPIRVVLIVRLVLVRGLLNPRRTAKENIAPSIPIARVAVPRPPVTLARPCLPVFTSALVAPSPTLSRKRSTSARVTAATLSDPKRGHICLSMRALSPARVLGFLVVCRRVRMRSARQPSR